MKIYYFEEFRLGRSWGNVAVRHLRVIRKTHSKLLVTLDKFNNVEIDFSDGFFDLHTKSYEEMIDNKGFGLEDVKPSIEIVHGIRNSEIQNMTRDFIPLAKYQLISHPFNL